MDSLHIYLNRDSFGVGERGYGGSIAETNDASCYIMMGKMSPQNCSPGGPSSEAHDLTIRATIISSDRAQARRPYTGPGWGAPGLTVV